MIGRILQSIGFDKNPRHLILHVTSKCNLKCKTCFADSDKYNHKEDLTLNEIEDTAKQLKKLIWLDISGGEPFMRRDLPDICSKFDTESISIPTNGFDADSICTTAKKIVNKTTATVTITLSLDGFEKTNDSMRGAGCFNKAMDTLRLLKTVKGIRIKINTVLCETNYDEVIAFMRFIRGFDVDFHSIIFLRGKPRNPEFRLPSYEKLEKLKNYIFEMWNKYDYGFNSIEKRILQSYQRCMYETSLKIIKESRQIPGCVAGKYHLVIYPNGNISFCEMLKPFGNLKEKNIDSLLQSTDAEIQRRNIKEKKCYCHHNCNMLDNYFLNPSQYPELLRGMWQ